MKKLSVLVLLGGLVLAAVMRGKRQSGEERPSKWEKMKKAMEEMPADFLPRVMFDNVATARENTDRILEILEKGGAVSQEVGDSA
jgi:hypothetical protein